MFMYIFGIPCFFYKVTSFYCPGCGFTRAVFALLHFDIYQALRYNLLIVLEILSAFPGMADEENMTTSSCCNLICL